MSSVYAGFDGSMIVETIETGRTYPKRAVISYLTGETINDCYKDGEGGELKECPELKALISHFGLLPLGPPKNRKFLGDHLIEAEIRRNTDARIESQYKRANLKAELDEGVGKTKTGGCRAKGKE